MKLKEYLQYVLQISSLVFFALVTVNLVLHKELLFNIIEFILFISLFSGLMVFMIFEKDTYSNRRIIWNQISYLVLVFSTIVAGDFIYHWGLGIQGLATNLVLVLLVFFFVKLVMYRNDQKDAEAMNEQIKLRKKAEEKDD